MSVAQHIRDRAGRFRWMGLLVVWAVFIAMAAVLLVERAGVQYSAGQHKLGMLAANDAVPASSAIFGQKPTCLVITDSDQDSVDDVKDQFDQILLDMKIAHRDVDIATDGADAIPSLTSFDRVIVLMPSLDGLGTHLTDLMSWVSAGGSLMLGMTPDNSNCLQAIASKLGSNRPDMTMRQPKVSFRVRTLCWEGESATSSRIPSILHFRFHCAKRRTSGQRPVTRARRSFGLTIAAVVTPWCARLASTTRSCVGSMLRP